LLDNVGHIIDKTPMKNNPIGLAQLLVNVLRELQVKGGEELRPFVGRTLMPSVLDRAFKGEL
jgi:hypothetical protein